jgi:hypothetical protein
MGPRDSRGSRATRCPRAVRGADALRERASCSPGELVGPRRSLLLPSGPKGPPDSSRGRQPSLFYTSVHSVLASGPKSCQQRAMSWTR